MEENTVLAAEKKKGLTGAALKWIAVISMFIDHTAAMVFITWLVPLRRAAGILPVLALGEKRLYWFLRGVGRPAFPIYCFLLVEGFLHTRDVKRYLGRLLAFGLLSELPFDFALFGHFTWYYQNVYFTLFLGLLGVWSISALIGADFQALTPGGKLLRLLGAAAVAVVCMAAAELANTDYGWTGVAVILLFYLFRRREVLRAFSVGAAVLGAGTVEAVSWIDFVLFHFYNGERGAQPKYFFYVFYPAHLALLWLIRFLAIGT